MLRTQIEDENEFMVIRTKEHIEKVWSAVKSNFDKYWFSMIERNSGADKLKELEEKFRVIRKQVKDIDVIRPLFIEKLRDYDNEASIYRKFFNKDYLEEFQDHDPNGFKRALKSDCPIIRDAVNSRREALQEWQYKFNKLTTGQEFLDIFRNLLDFAEDYVTIHKEQSFGKLDDLESYGLDQLDDEPEYRIEGVIGSGIKSCVLYYLYPRCFPRLNRGSMYGLYFLSGKDHFGLGSRTSEFLMIYDRTIITDKNIKMDHNYWYPYGLLTLYAMRLYRLIDDKAKSMILALESDFRFVYVICLFDEIWQKHEELINTMMCVGEMDF